MAGRLTLMKQDVMVWTLLNYFKTCPVTAVVNIVVNLHVT